MYVKDKIFNLELDGTVYVIDSTTIELCLNLFPWAKLKKVRAAVKLNLALELKGNIPAFFQISQGKSHDIHFLDFLEFEVGAYYIMDRGYVDFERLYRIHSADALFVTRAKDNFSFKWLYSNPTDNAGQDSYADTMPKLSIGSGIGNAQDVISSFVAHEQAWRVDQRVAYTLTAFDSLATYLSVPRPQNLHLVLRLFPSWHRG